MKDADIYLVAEKLSGLIPTFKRKFVRPLEQQVKYGLTPLQLHVMTILSEHDYLSMTELSQETRMCKQQMTPLIDKLMEHGFVSREPDVNDRRLLRISLTPEGARFLKDTRATVVKILKDRIEGLEEHDLERLDQALEDLFTIFKKIP